MAEITRVDFKERNTGVELSPFVAIGAESSVDFKGQDDKIVILCKGGSSAGKVTVKAGNALQGIEGENLTVDVGAGKMVPVVVESGAFMNTSGTKQDKVIISATGDVSAAAFKLL